MDDEQTITDSTNKTISELDLRTRKAYQFKTSVLERLREQRNSREFCDLVLCAENEKFNVHKCVLVASSDYFEAMISRSGMQEATADTIELKDITANGLRAVLEFIYTGELSLSIENIAEVLRAVTHLQVNHAIKLCEEFLIEETTVDNCIDVLSLADLFSIPVLEKINKFVLRNFPKVALNEGFKRLTYEQILYLIRSNEFRLYPEIKVFDMCVEWLKSDEKNRMIYASSLMEHVRFQTMKPEEFNDLVMPHNFMKTDPNCIRYAFEAYSYFSLPNRQYCSTSPRSKIRNEASLVCVNESMYILNKHDDVWEYMCNSLATWRTLSQKFVVVNNFLYACGGYSENNRETTNACYRFDPRTGLWSEIARLCEKRQFFSLAGSNECLVAVGGVYGDKGNFYATHPCSTAIEVYSIEKDQWRTLACTDLPILKWPGACVAENFAFVIGGKHTDGLNHRLSENSYMVDLESGHVTICAAPLTVRFNPTVFYQNKRLILFGGEDDKYRLAPCIEMYDLATNQWTEIATIPVSHSYQCISSSSIMGDKIHYLLEEHDGPSSESYILKSSYFDIEKRTFERSVQLPHPSTLASKWCSLVFPQQFLDGCQTFDNHESHHHHNHHHHHYHPHYNHYPSDNAPRHSLGEISSGGDVSSSSTNSASNSPMIYQRHRYYPELHHRTCSN
ncbi:unnamed protein product [Rotaria sp. Silwood1]|nr:unnamed protein product [Rotaria sp. Silwood1]CAF0954941.1 unnamed protein product [Rotaria sp. Silwood1]CAF4646523.1 unnamed protein product [Rotaria sp. Silwood1]